MELEPPPVPVPEDEPSLPSPEPDEVPVAPVAGACPSQVPPLQMPSQQARSSAHHRATAPTGTHWARQLKSAVLGGSSPTTKSAAHASSAPQSELSSQGVGPPLLVPGSLVLPVVVPAPVVAGGGGV